MISQTLLTAKGTIDALLALSTNSTDTSRRDLATLADTMDVADSTARNRLTDLADAGLVTMNAALVDETPIRVYSLTPDGETVADELMHILDGTETDETDE